MNIKPPEGPQVLAEQDQIKEFAAFCDEFCERVLDLMPGTVLVTDMSSLDDFRGCFSPAAWDALSEVEKDDGGYQRFAELWNAEVKERVEAHYDVRPDNVNVTLLVLFETIQQTQRRRMRPS